MNGLAVGVPLRSVGQWAGGVLWGGSILEEGVARESSEPMMTTGVEEGWRGNQSG
jgi:hypothetical protein